MKPLNERQRAAIIRSGWVPSADHAGVSARADALMYASVCARRLAGRMGYDGYGWRGRWTGPDANTTST